MSRSRLMRTPPQFVLSRLSRQLYLDFLETAKTKGFSFVRFQDFLPGVTLPSRYIALRHDIDFAPEYSLEISSIRNGRQVGTRALVGMDASVQQDLDENTVVRAPRPDVRKRTEDDINSIGFKNR